MCGKLFWSKYKGKKQTHWKPLLLIVNCIIETELLNKPGGLEQKFYIKNAHKHQRQSLVAKVHK